MGTSSSSKGSPSGGPITPPWVPPPPITPDPGPPPADDGDGDAGGPPDGDGAQPPTPPPPPPAPRVVIAPSGRFSSARRNLGDFARSGSTASMRRGVGNYVRTGLQGSRSASQRFGGTTNTAGALYGALSDLATGQSPPGSPLDRAILTGRSANQVITAIVEAVRSVDGTQDAEASRDAMQRALSATLEQYPDADLLNLTEDQRLFAIERYLALDVFNRACLDLWKHVQDRAPSVAAAVSRLAEMREYIRENIAAAFRKARSAGQLLNGRRVAAMARDALHDAFQVFEGEAA